MSPLFNSISIGSMIIKNRFVRSATNDYLGNSDGSISDQEVELYQTLAENDVGLIITAHTYVQHPKGRASISQNAIYEDRLIRGYQKLAQSVHPYGTKLVMQISHAGRQTTTSITEGQTPIAPSMVIDQSTGQAPREMSEAEILTLITDFVAAIGRAKTADCDGVQLHIAHGYALSQFLSPYTNRRSDQWGGSIENRTRIIKEIITQGKLLVGADYPILVKLNSTDGFSDPGYLSLDDVLYTAKLLESLGTSAIEVSGGIKEAKGVMSRPGIKTAEQEAYFAVAAKAIKQVVSIPIILVGGLRSKTIMEHIITSQTADMVALSRPFVKEPNLVTKLLEGQETVACVSCNACFNPNGLKCYYKGKD
ncbi:NADH oxidase [bioreactor metagenome]|uniref:NADH oxidase n=1 Tax=bioreactor metagenome TaxID=1076179 RepID=A0A644UR84_9ZZZZ|nr:NADH:flavin oxidoreductase [Negativicutes bacterium]